MTASTHPRIAIAACLGGTATFLFYLAAILLFRVGFATPQERWFSSPTLNVLLMGFVMFVPIPVHVVAFVMGVVSLFSSPRKLFPLLAVGLNAFFGLCSLFPWGYLVWLGLHTGVK